VNSALFTYLASRLNLKSPRSLRSGFSIIGFMLAATPAFAQSSFLDTDFWCRTYGCAVVHDGNTYDIYDNFIFARNRCCVAFGTEMTSFYNRARNTNITGTLDHSNNNRPSNNESFRLGIRDSVSGDISTIDDGNGYLDASDRLQAFALSSLTDISLDNQSRSYSHSFFISSRNTRFSIRGLAEMDNVTGDFQETLSLDDIALNASVTTSGNDDGFNFGGRTNNSGISFSNQIFDMGDLTGTPTEIARFDNFGGIRGGNAASINQQLIRMDLEYTMPDYDLSMGVGTMDINFELNFYREN